MIRWFLRGWLAATTLAACLTVPCSAEIVRFEITKREPFAEGRSFGQAGAYERIVGKVYFAIDPVLRQNEPIVDLGRAPLNREGKVEFSSDLFILAPREPAKGNGAIIYDVNNRGNLLALKFFNVGGSGSNDPRSGADSGDGFLMNHGFTIVWSGWDGELLPGGGRLRLEAPVAKEAGNRTITGPVRCEVVPTGDTNLVEANWDNHGSYRPTEKGLANATLTWRLRAADPRVPIPRDQWKLAVGEIPGNSPSQLPRVELEMPAGFKRGYIYEVIYEAKDPLVHGVCFASVRDLISGLKNGSGAGNPLLVDGKSVFKRAHGFGVSQSGRFLREFLHAGFNEDEQGRKVFDGLIPHVSGGGLGSFNHRFAQPTRHVNQHDHHDYPADRFPFAYETQTDPLSGQSDGILAAARVRNVVPLIMHTQSAGEYWTRSGSLAHTDPLGQRDSQVPQNVRIYLFGGTQHGPSSYPSTKGDGQNYANHGDYKPYLRTLLLALDRWSRDGTAPPKSVYPTIAGGTLTDWRQMSSNFPFIPGIRYPDVIQQPSLLDFGPRWMSYHIMDVQPPRAIGDYRVLVPRCGPDGNELDCLSPPEVAVPLGTHTGWNLRRREAGAENELVSLGGSYIAFAVKKADRLHSGDPRPSLEERYQTLAGYLQQLDAKLSELQSKGYLLAEDAQRIRQVQQQRARPLFNRLHPSNED